MTGQGNIFQDTSTTVFHRTIRVPADLDHDANLMTRLLLEGLEKTGLERCLEIEARQYSQFTNASR